jgi:uncharacterized protein YbjT (DUF2867 family)
MSLLILGGTGTLGRQIVKQALDEGYQVKCLVRNLRRGAFLKDWGADLIYGDLSIPATIPPALKGVSIVIDAATVRPTDSYTAETIDWKGKIALIEAAKLAKIKKFIFFSVLNASQNSQIPLLELKVRFEQKLKESQLNYTIFQCSGFFQGLINQFAIPILEQQTVWLLGNSSPVAYLDTQDAARTVVKSISEEASTNCTFALTGNKFWTSEEVIEVCKRLSGKEAKVSYIPFILLSILRQFFRFFEFTWNISDRLQFAELNTNKASSVSLAKSIPWQEENLNLEQYLQEYFGKILKKLKETNYQQSQKSSDISFL